MTFLIIPKDGPDKAKRDALKNFIQYVITDGQATAGSLNYAPLPDGVKQFDQQQLQSNDGRRPADPVDHVTSQNTK